MKHAFPLALALALSAGRAAAYVDGTPSLGQLIKDSSHILVLQVAKVSIEKRTIIYTKVADLKGEHSSKEFKHQITDGWHPREPKLIMDWATPGQRAVCFFTDKVAVTCIGRYWYETAPLEAPWWRMTSGRPELALAYCGPVDRLRRVVPDILAGKEAVVTAIAHGPRNDTWQFNNVGLQKVLRGKDCPMWRIRASLKMPDSANEVGSKDSKWIVGLGAASAADVPALVEALKDSHAKRRADAADDLGLIGRHARPALGPLVKAFQDPDPLVRISAARAVALIGENPDELAPTLENALKHTDPVARKAAALALGDIGSLANPAVGALTEALGDSDATVRWNAAEALGRLGGDAESAVPRLAAALRDPALRSMAAAALGGIGAASRGAVPLLTDGLRDADESYRWTVAVALARIDARSARAALPLFIDRLKSSDPRARWDAMMVVSAMGLEARGAKSALLPLIKDGDGVAASTLATIAGPDAIEALPLFIKDFADDSDNSDSIAQIGPAAVPALVEVVKKKETKGRHLAVKALGQIGRKSKAVLPELIGALNDSQEAVRRAAADALAGIDPKAQEAVPALTRSLQDGAVQVRLAAASALVAITGTDDSVVVVAAMAHTLADEDAGARREAALVLAKIGAAARWAVPALQRALQDADGGVRSSAAFALARIATQEANRSAVAVMVPALKDRDARARQDAARLLGQIGADAKPAIGALTEALQDPDETVRKAAAEALEKIQAK